MSVAFGGRQRNLRPTDLGILMGFGSGALKGPIARAHDTGYRSGK